MLTLAQQVLRTDVSGMPLEWISYQTAVKLHFSDQIAYACGSTMYELYGGINAKTHQRSSVEVNSIIATHGNSKTTYRHHTPPLNNATLFRRDNHQCLYCGNHFKHQYLSRDHIQPMSRKGHDTWNNVVTACKRCNNHKANKTPEEAGMELLAIPFTPTHAEYVYLKGRRVLADQMAFLKAHFPRTSPLHDRVSQHQEHISQPTRLRLDQQAFEVE